MSTEMMDDKEIRQCNSDDVNRVEVCKNGTDDALPVVYISRTDTFSASHRLHSLLLSDEENRKTYGPCNNPNGHGHNYKVKVTIRGKVDPVTGMVLNLKELDQHMQVAIKDLMDHKHIDKDVLYFKDKVSSAENISVFIWNNLQRLLPKPDLLYEVRIYETDKNAAYYRGEVG